MAVLKFRSMGTAGNHGMGTVGNHGSTHVCRLWSRDERHLFCSSCLCPFFCQSERDSGRSLERMTLPFGVACTLVLTCQLGLHPGNCCTTCVLVVETTMSINRYFFVHVLPTCVVPAYCKPTRTSYIGITSIRLMSRRKLYHY